MKRTLFIYALAVFFGLVVAQGFTSFMLGVKHNTVAIATQEKK